MNLNDINKLAEIMRDTGLTSLAVEDEKISIKLERAAPTVSYAPEAHSPITGAPNGELRPEEPEGTTVKSPTVGVIYASATPESNPYVSIGSKVKTGEVLCVIEAMKLMNEITADCDGEIAEICVGNGQVVEYGQPLFRIR
ncbi:MAG: acetyl-CoA carboxylase biotin carboxyl carrier protein [Oscillospiraceae bacterium]